MFDWLFWLSIIDPSSGSDQSLSASAVGGGAPPAQTGPESRQACRAESSSGAGATGATGSTIQASDNDPNEAAMIMDGLETMSFAEGNVNFHHLLNFETFKAEMPDDSANITGIVRRSEPNSINDSLNTPVSGFLDFPIFFGPSVVLPIPSALTGKMRPSVYFSPTSSQPEWRHWRPVRGTSCCRFLVKTCHLLGFKPTSI